MGQGGGRAPRPCPALLPGFPHRESEGRTVPLKGCEDASSAHKGPYAGVCPGLGKRLVRASVRGMGQDSSQGWQSPFPVEWKLLKISARMPSAECQLAGGHQLGVQRSQSSASCHPPGGKCHLLGLFLDQRKGWVGRCAASFRGWHGAHLECWWGGLKTVLVLGHRESDPGVLKRPFLAKVTSPPWEQRCRKYSPDTQPAISDPGVNLFSLKEQQKVAKEREPVLTEHLLCATRRV